MLTNSAIICPTLWKVCHSGKDLKHVGKFWQVLIKFGNIGLAMSAFRHNIMVKCSRLNVKHFTFVEMFHV